MQKLISYLGQLDSAETQWGIWVNPRDYDFRVGQKLFDNGGLLDDWVFIGTLDKLSFGSQSEREAFESVATEILGEHRFNVDALYDAWADERLAEDLQEKFTAAIDAVCKGWAEEEAGCFVHDRLPQIFAESTCG